MFHTPCCFGRGVWFCFKAKNVKNALILHVDYVKYIVKYPNLPPKTVSKRF